MRRLVDTIRNRPVRRATVDTVAPPPSPLQPIDLTDNIAVTEVLRLASWVGEVLLASGTGAIDTMVQVEQVAAAYGLTECDVDITYNSIAISARRGPTLPPAGSIRIVKYRTHDFTRLAAVDRLVRRIRRGAATPEQAAQTLHDITASGHPYPQWVATGAWAGMAASVAWLLGGGLAIIAASFLATLMIQMANRWLDGHGLPAFFQQVIGGFIATVPASALYAMREHLDLQIRPSLVIASGVVVLLSGLSLVGSVQDAITGAPVTAAGRFFEVLMMTGGIIAGVAIGLRTAAAVGFALPAITADQFSGNLTQLPAQMAAGALTAACFALACYAEVRATVVAFVSGAAGTGALILAGHFGVGQVLSAAAAATIIGLAGGLLARRALTPPVIVGIAGITPLLPGLAIYRGLYSILNEDTTTGFTDLVSAMGVGAGLAAGVVLGEWCARVLRRPRILERAASLRRPIVRRRIRPPSPRPAQPRQREPRKFAHRPASPGPSRPGPRWRNQGNLS
ncbi:threonine/serine ThrE exporter family protein [Tomitella biformata]|uniref:threonine/serine ThrE exporter family protein n=1 Tax=Tomitella biformata TaxID=630403 RepID=UPI000464CD05|nr:threonine/serine exporter family protein [Tomitella biformata]